MNNLKESHIGFDRAINKIQVKMYDKLQSLWGVNLDGYPLCYDQKIEKRKGIVHYRNSNEYSKSLIHKEGNKFFFLKSGEYKQVSRLTYSGSFDLFFIVNLKECKPLINSRAEEEVLLDVLNIFDSIGIVSEDLKVVFGKENVFRGYEVSDTIDTHPYHCFKITFNINEFDLFKKPC